MKNEMGKITISTDEYRRLKEAWYMLANLEECGVEEWDGYDEAMVNFRKEIKGVLE